MKNSNAKVGIVEFFCYTNKKNNTPEKSLAYRFLQDAVVNAVETYLRETQEHELDVRFSCGRKIVVENERKQNPGVIESREEEQKMRVAQYVARTPFYSFDRLILPKDKIDELLHAANLFKHKDLIFKTWNLGKNNPFTASALNLYGERGTGKTLAAHAIASYLGKKIILASYGQIESMYHGEGPKNVEAIFTAAEQQDAVLLIDEADSLLSARIENPRQGSENAINSMRSQILICLEKFNGVVVFATNLVSNYDKAMKSRIRNIKIEMPDEECRRRIWEAHLPTEFPQDDTVVLERLAEIDGVCGRDIRNAVQMTAEIMADEGLPAASYKLLSDSLLKIRRETHEKGQSRDSIKLSPKESSVVTKIIKEGNAEQG